MKFSSADITQVYEIKNLSEIIDDLVIFQKNEQLKKIAGDGISKLLDLDVILIKRGLEPVTFFFFEEIVRKKLKSLLNLNL